jgi:TatD DNase family protein
MHDFDDDRDEVVARAVQAGVSRIITVGTNVASSKQAIALAEKCPQVYAAVGIHPHDALNVTQADITRIAELAKHSKVVALGEMGLDFYRLYSPKDSQFQVLQWQLELATDLGLPVIIHARQATKEMMYVLSEWVKQRGDIPEKPPGVIHCFGYNIQSISDDIKTARHYLGLGFYLAFGGYVSYPRSNAPAVIKELPTDRLLVETDCPFLPPQQYRGKRNEPSYTPIAVKVMADAVGVSIEAMAKLTTENAGRLFKFQ